MKVVEPPRSIPDGVYYIILADLVGSTAFAAKSGNDAAIARSRWFVNAAQEALQNARPNNSGYLVKIDGDAVVLVFSHFPDVVQWYLEFLGSKGLCVPCSAEPIESRVWVHVGEVRFSEGDLNGLAVNELFKIEKNAKEHMHPDSMVLTDLAQKVARATLFPKQVVLKRSIEVKFSKQRPARLYQLVVRADIAFLLDKQRLEKR